MQSLWFAVCASSIIWAGAGVHAAGASELALKGSRTCTDAVTFQKELCDPGEVNVVEKPFDLYAKDRTISVEAPPAMGLPAVFRAYVFDFSANPQTGSLAPPVFHVPKGRDHNPASLGTIRFKLHNELPRVLDNTIMLNNAVPAGEQPINIHTHGLVVLPTDAHGKGPYGDFVGVLGCPEHTQSSCPVNPSAIHATEVCGMAKRAREGHPCPGAMAMQGHEVLLDEVPYAIGVPGTHPASFSWFHPHAHEISSAQVGAGLAGVLTIGSLCSDPAFKEYSSFCKTVRGESALDPDKIHERYLMLKDLEVFDSRQGGNGTGPASAEGYRIVPQCNFPPGAPAIVTEGSCAFSGSDSTSGLGGHWLFTVNGQIQPKLTMHAGTPELWRVANLSSNATYKLSLCKGDPKPDATPGWDPSSKTPDPQAQLAVCNDADYVAFQIVSLDGGLKAGSGTLSTETEALLPPGARAEIIVRPVAGENLKLVQKGFVEPDLYPPVVLATASTPDGTGDGPPISFDSVAAPKPAKASVKFPEPADCKTRAAGLGPNDWLSLPSQDEVVSVFFGKVSNDPEILTLGLMRGNPETSTDPTTRAHALACMAGGDSTSFDCQWFKGGPFTMENRNLCLKHGTKVTFRLYNFTNETHNFHIHQQKFEVTPVFSTAPKAGVDSASAKASPSVAAVVGSQMQRASLVMADMPSGAPVVDSVPVPSIWIPATDPGGAAGNNPVPQITMVFDKPEQVGDFVFHCHILEHEDKGMMKRITVYTEH